jgi:2-oxo-4-hydroxy-4-carboxy-5-ureidoimidazoline decarboxylase
VSLSLAQLNRLPAAEAAEHLGACCGASRWVEGMIARRPFADMESLLAASDREWRQCGPKDWVEAFAHHPRIGERHATATVSATARGWSSGEQGAAARADDATRAALARGNAAYERRFDRIYIVCATGRSAQELLADIERRMQHDPDRELAVAAEEQGKITRLRLLKLLGAEQS